METNSLKHILFDSFFPRRKIAILFLFIVLLSPISVLMVQYMNNSSESISVSTIYRSPVGDIQYYEIISALSKFNFGESNLFEMRNQSIQGFPFISLIIHAICFRLFGAVGFWIADIIVSYLFFCLLTFFFKLIFRNDLVALIVSLLICTSFISTVAHFTFPNIFHRISIWGLRIPRPFIAELFMLSTLIANILLLTYRNKVINSLSYWILSGISLSFLIQSDLYAGFTFSILFLILLFIIFTKSSAKLKLFYRIIIMGIAVVITSLPILYQQLHVSHSLVQRFGSFPIQNIKNFMVFSGDVIPIIGLLLIAAVLVFIYYVFDNERYNNVKKIVLYFLLLDFLGLISLFLFCFITRKGIQLYNFEGRTERYISYSFIVFLGFLMSLFLNKISCNERFKQLPTIKIKYLLNILLAFIAILSLRHVFQQAKNRINYQAHMRTDIYNFKDYRKDFNELATELVNYKNKNYVLGTFDHQVHVYWQTFCNGWSFLPDLFISTAEDSIAEQRLNLFVKKLNMNNEQFSELLQQPSVTICWLVLAKYQASKAYTYADISDYSQGLQDIIKQTSVIDNWSIIMPDKERVRLESNFKKQIDNDFFKLDMIVLTNDSYLINAKPDSLKYEQVFANKTFKMWKRRQ